MKNMWLPICALAFLAVGCATSSTLTDTLSAMGDIASAAGMDEASAALNAGSALSKANEEITPENEYYIGRSVAAAILTNYDVYTAASLEAYLNKICGIIVANSDSPELYNGYHVKILDSAEVNAFSTSGGHILVTRGLLACAQSEDALAAVIAHEIAHIQLQHSLRAIKANRYSEAVKLTAAAAVTVGSSKEMASTLDGMVGDVFTQMVNNGYSQKQEFQADELALTLMAEAGYDPTAMNEMLTVMKSKQGTSKAGFYKTHPSPDSRIKNVNTALKSVTAPVDTRGFRATRFQRATK